MLKRKKIAKIVWTAAIIITALSMVAFTLLPILS